MPKDPTRNIDRYKIRGGTLNTFDFARNRTEMSEGQSLKEAGTLIPPSDEPERVARLLAKYGEAQPKPERPRKRAAGAKKAAAKPATKASPRKAGGSRKQSPRSASAKTGARQSAAKKAAQSVKRQAPSKKK